MQGFYKAMDMTASDRFNGDLFFVLEKGFLGKFIGLGKFLLVGTKTALKTAL